MIDLYRQLEGLEQKHKEIFHFIRRHRIISKQQLQELTTFPFSTLTRILDELIEQKYIIYAGLGESTGGRKPNLYQINPHWGYVFGLEISRTFSKLMLFDLQLESVTSTKWEMNEKMSPEHLVAEIFQAVISMLQASNISQERVIGMGIGAVGPIDSKLGVITEPLYFLAKGWFYVPICQILEEKLQFPIFLENGSNMALLGEYQATSPEAIQHLLYVHVGVGIRSAMMTGGKLVYGAVDMEGAIGQMIIQADGTRLHNRNNFGALENFASIYAIERQAILKMRSGHNSILKKILHAETSLERVPFAQLVEAYDAQDPMTIELFTEAATYFGVGLANLLNILHPEKVILGGPLISFDPMFYQISTKVALEKTYYYPTYQVEFSLGLLGEDAVVSGAAEMLLQKSLS